MPCAGGERARGRRAPERARASAARRGGGRRSGAVGEPLLEPLDPVDEGLLARARLVPRDAHHRDLEHQTRVGDALAADVDDRVAEDLDRAHDRGVAHLLRERGEALALLGCTVVGHAPGGVRLQERVAQRAEEVVGDAPDVVARGDHVVHTDECARDVVGRGRFEDGEPQLERCAPERRLHLHGVDAATADGEGLVEEREGVARGTGSAAGDQVERLGVGLDALAPEDVGQVADELTVREQGELEVLRARAQRGEHLLRVGRGEHEHDVRGRFLERLQQRVRGRRREHVDLVDDVDLPAARRPDAQVHALDELPHRVDAVVRRRVELDEVEEGAGRHGLAVLAHAARLAVGAEVRQLSARARRRAVVVLPVPRGPENR